MDTILKGKKIELTIVFVTMLCCHLMAVTSEEVVDVEFTALSLGGTLRGYQFNDSKGSHDIVISNGSRTPVNRYVGSPTLAFYSEEIGDDDQVTRTPLASIDMTNKAGRWLLVFVPIGNGDYRIFALDDSDSNFPANTWNIINFSRYSMAMRVGEREPFIISPRGNNYVLAINEEGNSTEKIQVAINQEDNWTVAYRSLWGARPNSRSLIFLLNGGENSNITVRRFHETVRN